MFTKQMYFGGMFSPIAYKVVGTPRLRIQGAQWGGPPQVADPAWAPDQLWLFRLCCSVLQS